MSEQIQAKDRSWLTELAGQLRPAIEASVATELFDKHGEIRTVEKELRRAIFEQTGVEV